MGRGIYEELIGHLSLAVEGIPAKEPGPNSTYSFKDAVNGAFGGFFFQFPSFLRYMREMEEREKRNNACSLLDIKEIPSDAQIRNLVDEVEPGVLSPVFNETLRSAERRGVLAEYRVLGCGVLLALDGLWYHGSEKIHCSHCQKQEKDGVVTYYHSAVAGAVVKPGGGKVLPVMAELVRCEDGTKKQDCEINAAKRWLTAHGEEYWWLKPTLLGDDLYSHYPFCAKVREQGYSFIFTCKESSHPWLAETVRNSYLKEISEVKWNGRKHIRYTWRYLAGVPLRDDRETMEVNYFSLEIRDEASGKRTYYSSWITDKTVTDMNVAYLAVCARTRWKIENEHNNTLKNRGYNLEHNFGHGKNHAAENFFLLNLLAFSFHTILEYCDPDYRKVLATFSVNVAFFEGVRFCLRRRYFSSWAEFLEFVYREEGQPPPIPLRPPAPG